MVNHAGATAAGLLADRAFGEPHARVHPVALFGSMMQRVERVTYAARRSRGVVYTTVGCAAGAIAGRCTRNTAAAVALAAAGRELRTEAAHVRDALLADDVPRARILVTALVGRDPSELDASELAAATIESLAENTVDAVVAPAFWAVVAGGPGALAYRAVNTMDAMVGHHSARYEEFGWAAARLDDVANFVPARLTAALVAAVRPGAARSIARAVTTQARRHPSPNAGVAEAAFAAALGCELGGPLRYGDRLENRPRLGTGSRPEPRDIDAAIRLASHVDLALVAALGTLAVGRRR